MKTSIELFNLYIAKELPYFRYPTKTKISFCTHTSCSSCHIQDPCDETAGMLPTLTPSELEKVKEDHPEYMI
jgi:hypothetical protein